MSESQTGAGNLKHLKNVNLNFLKCLKFLNFVNIKNDPRDMLNNFCFHVYAQNAFLGPPHPMSLPIIELVPS